MVPLALAATTIAMPTAVLLAMAVVAVAAAAAATTNAAAATTSAAAARPQATTAAVMTRRRTGQTDRASRSAASAYAVFGDAGTVGCKPDWSDAGASGPFSCKPDPPPGSSLSITRIARR